MNKICTSLEQSKKLIKLGIDINTADMYWHKKIDGTLSLRTDNLMVKLDTPAWSLSALFNILPKGVSFLKNSYDGTYAIINTDFENEDVKIEWHNDPIDAAFEMVCWLLENKKL